MNILQTVLAGWLCLLFNASNALPQPGMAADVIASFDYVVVGCGIAGLVVATRLSEDPSVSVLCLEAGQFDQNEDFIRYPIYIGQQPPGFYDWNINTIPQTQLDGSIRHIPMGRGVGGGSLTNGMLWNRGNADDFNAWIDLGNPGWGWNDLLPYFRKSETFTPLCYSSNEQEPPPIDFLAANHGFSGPVNVSYPAYFWRQSDNYLGALNDLGIPTAADLNDGNSVGAYFIPSNVDPVGQTRADARRSYYDPVSSRNNLVVQATAQVTRLLFSGTENTTEPDGISASLAATGVEFASDALAPRQTVLAAREIILAAGAIHTPKLLQLSGIGPTALLQSMNITTLQDIVGVGNNLQDHTLIHLNYSYQSRDFTTPNTPVENATYNAIARQQYLSTRTGPWTGRPSVAVGFPSLPQIVNTTYLAQLHAEANDANLYAPVSYDASLTAGLTAQLSTLVSRLAQNTTPAYENLNNNAGGLDLALMHPLSRGTVTITSTDPFAPPAVDPRWLAHPFDFDVMLSAMQFNQRILDHPAISPVLEPSYPQIPPNATVEQLTAILRAGVGTEFHSSGTAAMLPQSLGGVVDPSLLVYGTSNLRVVDTSIFPLIPAAHLQAVVYAVAEKAADIIKAAAAAETAETPNATQTATSTATATGPANGAFTQWLLCHLGLENSTTESNAVDQWLN